MPLTPLNARPTSGQPAAPSPGLRKLGADQPVAEEGMNVPAIAGGAAAVGGLAFAGSKLKDAPGVVGKIGKVASGLNALRQQLMLSGFALPKSLLGNVGAAVNASAEAGSLNPLKALLSKRTLTDAMDSFKTGSGVAKNPAGSNTMELPKALSLPGRMMGAMDEATQKALQRGGLTPEMAQRETLQSPLTGSLGEAFESTVENPNPMMTYLHPFRRTPFNQMIEGAKAMSVNAARKNPITTAATYAAGATHGSATSDDQFPLSVPLAMAAAGRRGLPYGVAALIARGLSGGQGGGGIAGSMLPVSEYGYEQSLSNPLKPFQKPAALTALEKITGQ